MLLVLGLVLLFLGYSVAEYAVHRHNLSKIGIRVQVNGTRGKSSVTRLIAGGLRAGGLRTFAKVTGTRPRFIIGDAEEHPVRRLGKPNIAEDMRIVRLARRGGADALVMECMALIPHYQWVENRLLVRPTHGVITNVRADHLDVMGPTAHDVGRALANTVPVRGAFFTAERGPEGAALVARARAAARVTVSHPDDVTDDEMGGFSYVEHKENVALALAVCQDLGVDRATALAGMQRATPDPGVMRIYRVSDARKCMDVVNTLAANDPDSIGMLWEMMRDRRQERIVLVNCRRDRTERSHQLADLVAGWDAAWFVATGGLTRAFIQRALANGVPRAKILDLGDDRPPSEIYDQILALVAGDALVFATGNTVGYGEELISFFAGKGVQVGS